MKTKIYLSAICALAMNVAASDLGTIQVESSTIDDKFANKLTEVSSTSTLSGDEVEEFHAENIADVLNTLPGVTVRKNEGDSNKIHIRGVATEMYMGERPGVAIVIDGVPVQERAGAVNIDVDNIESIKVLKGGASYLYGNDAIAGAVIITTKRPKGKSEGLVGTEQGSYGYEKYLASYTAGTENFAANVQASYKASDGYWEDSDYYTKSVNGKFQYYIDDSSDITFGADKTLRYENDTGSITHTTFDGTDYTNNVETNPTSEGEVGYSTDYDIDLTKLFLTYSKDFDNSSNLMAQIYQYDDTTENKSSAYDSDRDGVRDDHLYDAYANTVQRGLKSEYRLDGTKIASMLGLDLARNEEDRNTKYRVDYTDRSDVNHTIGEVTSNTEGKEAINAIYGELKYAVTNDFTTTLNARYDNINYDYTNNLTSTNWDTDYNEASYRVGTTYNLAGKQIIFASISTGFRVPTLSQIYAGDMSTSTYSGTYYNNTDIDTEKTYNYEIGLRYQDNLLSYEFSVFQLDRKGVIGKSSGNYASTSGVDVYYDNMADVQNTGLELGISSNKQKDVSFVFNYTYLDSRYTKYDEYNKILFDKDLGSRGEDYVEGVYDLSGNKVPRTSDHTIYLEGNYRPIKSVLVTADVSYRSSQYADEMNEVKVDGYAIVNLRAKYNVTLANFDIEMFGKIENIFDEQYYMMPRVTGDRNDDNLYDLRDMGLTVNPGRTFLAGLSAKF
ncbi:MAG: TonB-dependent receptor [Campylobacterota bacterium]